MSMTKNESDLKQEREEKEKRELRELAQALVEFLKEYKKFE